MKRKMKRRTINNLKVKKEKNPSRLSPKLLFVTRLALVVLVMSVAGLFLYFFQPDWLKLNFHQSATASVSYVEPVASSSPAVCLDCLPRLLDGVLVKPEFAKLSPFSVMIDNFLGARPQSGLSAASLVYEAPAEGGITRYEAFFSPDNLPSEIGPIRSARPYFVNWAKELGAVYVHVGGSPDALDLVKTLGKSNLDEFSNSSYFWRSDSRSAPHNILTSGDKLNQYKLSIDVATSELIPWKFKAEAASSTANALKISINYSDGYKVYWKYQANNNNYERHQDGNLSSDAAGNIITAKNIIIHVVPFTVSDDKLRLTMSTALSGPALVCLDGNCKVGIWKKNSAASRAKYYDKQGVEFEFNAGTTWVEVVSDWSLVEY